MDPTRLGLCLCVCFAAIVHDLVPAVAAQDAGERFWNQPRGDALGTAAVDVAPLQDDPQVIWRDEPGEILGEPVVWGDTLFVLTREASSRTLYAYSIESGEQLAKKKLPSAPDFTHLAAWQGTVAVVEPKAVQLYQYRKGKLSRKGAVKGAFLSPPCVADGYLFAGGPEGELACIDLGLRKLVAETTRAGYGRPTVHRGTVAMLDVKSQPGYQGRYFALLSTPISGLGERKSSFGGSHIEYSGLVKGSRTGAREDGYVVVVADRVWTPAQYGRSPVPLQTADGDTCPGAIFGTGKLSTIASAPTVYGGELYGFAADGTFVRQMPDGRYFSVVTLEELPPGARMSDATRARSVAYLGNWAVDLDSKRVLWCERVINPAGPLLPVADGRVVYWTTAGELYCLGGRAVEALAGAPAEALAPRPTRPGTGDGVVLEDGRRYPGAVERLADGGVRLVPADGEARTIAAAELALVESGEARELVGMEHGVLRAWLDALNAEAVDELAARFEEYLEARLVSECQRLLVELRARGLSDAREAELRGMLAGKAESTAGNAERQRAKRLREETSGRLALAGEFLAAAAWCEALELDAAATVLLAEAEALCPEVEGVEQRVLALVPEAFPWRGAADAAERWKRWAAEVLPAGGRFVAAGDPLWSRVEGTIWAPKTTALATPNLLMFTKADDAAVVGACLRNGEAAVRALEELFGRSDREEQSELFEVRLHADEDAYRAERKPDGSYAMSWSAGYYSPSERVSRFYVPSSSGSPDPLGRELHKVFAHELTHQYLAQAWIPTKGTLGGDPGQPGCWVVEGVARFVEDQVVEMGRRGRRFDDGTVKSLDATAQLAESGGLIPLEQFVDLSHRDFMELADGRELAVQLQNTLRRISLSERAIFYEQAGSLVFFLVNGRGQQGRAALRKYLRAHYRRRARDEGWSTLGFESAEELEREFRTFLASLR